MGLAKRVVQGLQGIVDTLTILPGLAEKILSKVAHAKVYDLGQPCVILGTAEGLRILRVSNS